MDRYTVCQQLKNYIRFANLKFSDTTKNQQGQPQETYKYNTAVLTKREQDNIYGLYLFMMCNPEVGDEVLNSLINDDATQLRTLKSLGNEFPGLVNNLRAYGFNTMCNSIAQARKLNSSDHKI